MIENRRSKIFWSIIAILPPLSILIASLVLWRTHAWEKYCGNYEINYYGRAVDSYGRPLSGVKLDFEISAYRTRSNPWDQRSHKFSLYTDLQGNFEVVGEWGISFAMIGASKDHDLKDEHELPGVPVPKCNFVLTDVRSRAEIPHSSPESRIIFPFKYPVNEQR